MLWLTTTESLHILPHLSPSHAYVCPTFPFCYQARETGAWKIFPAPDGPKETTNILKNVDIQSSDCLYHGYYCRSDASNLFKEIAVDGWEECQEECEAEAECLFFSFHETRGQPHCSLLRTQCLVRTGCTAQQKCVTGKSSCSCPKIEYIPGEKSSSEYSRWTCGEVDPYSTDIPVGTTCSVTCASWKDPSLQSTCLTNWKRSTTSPKDSKSISLLYAAPYPTPDQPDMECGCEAIGPYLYDPNDEAGAEFACQGWLPDRYKKAGGWTIQSSDKCELFCSNGKNA